MNHKALAFLVPVILAGALAPRPARADCAAPTGTYYVAPTGNDAGQGTMGDPWQTINHAIQSTGPGACVYVRAGDYDEGSEIWIRPQYGGAPGKVWELTPYPGEAVTLKTRVLMEASYIRVRGFSMASGAPIIARELGGHREIIGNHFSGAYTYAAVSLGGDDLLAEGNVIELDGTGTTEDHGIYVMYGANKTIRGNVITHPPGYGIHVYDENKYMWPADISGVVIEDNFIRDAVSRSGVIVASDGVVQITGVKIRRNVIVNTPQSAIQIWKDKITTIDIVNNTLIGGATSVSNDGAPGVHVINNILWGGTAFYAGSFVEVDTNLYGPAKTGGELDSHPLYADPLFVDAAKDDYHLSPGSPAVDKGKDVGLPFAGSAPDLGAYELGSDTGPGSDGGNVSSSGAGMSGGSGGAGGAGAGGGGSSKEGGCGCRLPGAGQVSFVPSALVMVLAGLGAALRRRRYPARRRTR